MVRWLHAESLYSQRNKELAEEEEAGKCNEGKSNAVSFIQNRKEKSANGSRKHEIPTVIYLKTGLSILGLPRRIVSG